jgi:hypothetical protein
MPKTKRRQLVTGENPGAGTGNAPVAAKASDAGLGVAKASSPETEMMDFNISYGKPAQAQPGTAAGGAPARATRRTADAPSGIPGLDIPPVVFTQLDSLLEEKEQELTEGIELAESEKDKWMIDQQQRMDELKKGIDSELQQRNISATQSIPTGMVVRRGLPESRSGVDQGSSVSENPSEVIVIIDLPDGGGRRFQSRDVSTAPSSLQANKRLPPEEAATVLIEMLYNDILSRFSRIDIPSQTLMDYYVSMVEAIYETNDHKYSYGAVDPLTGLQGLAEISGAYSAHKKLGELIAKATAIDTQAPTAVPFTTPLARHSSAPAELGTGPQFGGRRKTKRHKKSKKSKKKHKKSKKAHRRKKSKKTKRPKRSKK